MNLVEKKSILKILNHLYQLKFIRKQLNADSKKCTKEEELELAMVKIAVQRGNKEAAKIHAQNSIRKKNESLIHLRMAARVDAAVSRIQFFITTEKAKRSIAGAEREMHNFNPSMRFMNLDRISALLSQIERQF